MVKHRSVPTTAFVLALLCIGSAYWICSWLVPPGASLDQRILFRPDGDSDYLPQAAALSRLHLRETAVRELANTGVRSFPIVALILHATMMRLFGDTGFVLAEILVFLLYGYLLSRFLQSAGIARGVAEVLAIAVVSGAANLIIANSSRIVGSIPLLFWSSRFPRPSVTELFVVILLILLIRLLDSHGPAASAGDWFALGIAGSCLLQADIYPVVALAVASGIIVVYLLLRDFRRTVRGLCIAALAAAVLSAPFLYQRIHELPDIPRRWGMFSIHGHYWFLFTPLRLFVITALVLIVAATYWFRSSGENRALVRATVPVMALVLVVSSFAGPLSLFLLGKGIQIYHYSVAAETMAAYAVLICAGWIVQDVLSHTRLLSIRRAMAFATATVFVACVAVAGWLSYQSLAQVWWGRTQPATPDPHIRARLDRAEEKRYRSSFNELHELLSRPEWSRTEVVGTFDGQVANWWEYRNKYVYLPDIFNTTVSDGEIENRVYSFMHLLEATPQDFSRALDNWYFLLRVLSGAKYQANMMYTPWPLQAYSRDNQVRILHTAILANTNLELPEPEKARLMDAYTHFDSSHQHARKLDMIVLSQGGLRQYVHPENGRFKLVWKNRVFEVWIPVE